MLFETKQLILREFQPDDSLELAPILANPQVMKFSITGCLTLGQTQKKIGSFIDSYHQCGFGKWAVILKERSQLIGYCGLAIEAIDGRTEIELGYRLDQSFWGRGLATEAAKAALEYGFNQLKLPRIVAVVEPENIASVRVIKKLEMNHEKQTLFYGLQMDVYTRFRDEFVNDRSVDRSLL